MTTLTFQPEMAQYQQALAEATAYKPRPRWSPLLPAVLALFALASWASDGIQVLNDFCWFAMGAVAVGFLLEELKSFANRFGVGGIIWWGGILIWFVWDYAKLWSFMGDRADVVISLRKFSGDLGIIAKATTAHLLFITIGTIMLNAFRGKWLAGLIAKIPQPRNPALLFTVILILFGLGIAPYFLFNRLPWYEAIWVDFTGFRANENVFTVGRTGRLNFNWGGYIAFVLHLTYFAALLAAFYAIFLSRHIVTTLICWFIYLFALADAFGSGTRGNVVSVGLPVLGMLFIYYHDVLRNWWKSVTPRRGRAFAMCMLVLLFLYLMMQIQAYNRRSTALQVDLSQTELLDPRDNTMFSQTLVLFERIPQTRDPFYATVPGITLVRPPFDVVADFFIGMIPRALWPDKPIDEAIDWSNRIKGGARGFGQSGATLSTGAVGYWFLRYGWPGVVWGGIIFGLLLSAVDQAIWRGRDKPMVIIIALAIHEFLFRSFRDLKFLQFYPTFIAILAYCMLMVVIPKYTPLRDGEAAG